jgi:hypothetical protein
MGNCCGLRTFFTSGVEIYGFEEVVHCLDRRTGRRVVSHVGGGVGFKVEKTHMSCERGLSIKLIFQTDHLNHLEIVFYSTSLEFHASERLLLATCPSCRLRGDTLIVILY